MQRFLFSVLLVGFFFFFFWGGGGGGDHIPEAVKRKVYVKLVNLLFLWLWT